MVRKLILLAGCTMLLASLFGCSATVATYPEGYYYTSGYYPRSNVYIYRAPPPPRRYYYRPYGPYYRPYRPYGPYRRPYYRRYYR